MPFAVTEELYQSVPAEPRLKQWTRREVEAMAETGAFEDQRLELIEGQLVNQMRKKRPHANAALALLFCLSDVFGREYVDSEAPIDVAPEDNPTSEPVPDLTVLACPRRNLGDRSPAPEEMRLVVEVSDSTLGFDLKTKAALYARAGIVEYWVVDLNNRRVVVHRSPMAGQYTAVTAYSDTESVAPLAAPENAIALAAIFE